MNSKLLLSVSLIAVLVLAGQSLATAARPPVVSAAAPVANSGGNAAAPMQAAAAGAPLAAKAGRGPAPTVVDSSPTGSDVSVQGTIIEIAFSIAMNKTSVKTAFSISPVVAGGIGWSGDVLRYTPSKTLAANTTYTVSVNTTARSTGGVPLAAPYSWTFTTSGPIQSTLTACVGDSITEGLYPAALQKLLGSASTVGNFGAGGTTVTINNGGLAVPYINTAICQQAQQFMPGTVVMMLGTNDSDMGVFKYIARFVADYERLIRQFQAVPSNPRIFLVEPPAIYGTPYNLSNANLESGVIPRIDQVASEMGLPTIDVHSPTIGHPEYFSDGVHPNSKGAAVIANVIYQAIR